MKRPIVLAVVVIAAALGYHFLYSPPDPGSSVGGAAKAPRPEPVTAAKARIEPVPVEITGIGTVQASATVSVKSRVDGEVVAVHFRDGDESRPAPCCSRWPSARRACCDSGRS